MKGAARVPLFFLLSRFGPLSITGSFQDKDMRVVNQTVGDRCGHGGAVKYLAPVGKRQVGRDNRRFDLVPLADYLEEQI